MNGPGTPQEDVRCPKCEGIDYPGVTHTLGCPYDPDGGTGTPLPVR